MVGQYLVYETFHYCCHVKENAFVRTRAVRQHDPPASPRITTRASTTRYNMNLTFPIADWFMGTSDLKRGLIGHLFNGYSTTHVKDE